MPGFFPVSRGHIFLVLLMSSKKKPLGFREPSKARPEYG